MHDVQAFIVDPEVVRSKLSTFRNGVLCPLPQGLSLLPVTDEFAAELQHYREDEQDLVDVPVPSLTASLVLFAREISRTTPIVYISTFYFGGGGGQEAVLWINGEIEFGPQSKGYNRSWPNSPISQALRKLGVVAAQGKDEFDTLGLGRYRETYLWANSVKANQT